MQIYLFSDISAFCVDGDRIMKCPKCGKEWNQADIVVSNTFICTFCGENFGSNGEGREDIRLVLKELVDKYGLELLRNVDRVNALLMDYAPRSEKERKLLVMVMREGVLSQLTRLLREDEENCRSGINKCVKRLASDIWITEAAAKYAVYVLCHAIGLNANLYLGEEEETADNANSEQPATAEKLKILSKEMGLVSEDAVNYALNDCGAVGYKALAANLQIKTLVLPETIKLIYPKAFLNCINLQSISLPKGIQNIGSCAFEGCCSLKTINIPDDARFKIIDGLLIDKVGKRALYYIDKADRNDSNITNGVTVISKKTYDRAEVKRINIPMSVSIIEENAFYLTMNLERLEVDPKNTAYRSIDGVLHDREGKIVIQYPQSKSGVNYYLEDTVEEIGKRAFSCAKKLETVTFTGTLKKIGSKAFEYCMKIENLILPGNVEIIGERAFQYCENLQSVMLPRSITKIEDCAFYGCIGLQTVSIPKNVSMIGNLAFAHCSGLKSVVIQDNVSFIGDGTFVGCNNIEISVKNNPYIEAYCNSHGIRFKKI